jgi:FkbM family methyltransferase
MDLLTHNVMRNGYKTVTGIQLALGAQDGTVELWCSHDKFGRQSVYPANVPDPLGTISVRQRRGDRFWRESLGGRRVDVLKLDVEGAELDVLTSSPGLLDTARDVWVEFWPDGIEASDADPYDIVKVFSRAGFVLSYWNLVTGARMPLESVKVLQQGIDQMRDMTLGTGASYSPILYLQAHRGA